MYGDARDCCFIPSCPRMQTPPTYYRSTDSLDSTVKQAYGGGESAAAALVPKAVTVPTWSNASVSNVASSAWSFRESGCGGLLHPSACSWHAARPLTAATRITVVYPEHHRYNWPIGARPCVAQHTSNSLLVAWQRALFRWLRGCLYGP